MPEWWIGRKHSEETKRKMSEARKGKGNAFYGRTHSKEATEKMSLARKGKGTGSQNPIYGKPRSEAVRKKISDTRVRTGVAQGDRNPQWKGGISRGRKAAMATTAYKQWRKAVFERDGYTCQACGKRGTGDLEADHIKPWAYFPALRYDVANGRTLCVVCHRKTFKGLRKKWQVG